MCLLWLLPASGNPIVLVSDLDDTVKQSQTWDRNASISNHAHPDGQGPRPFPWLIKIYQALNPAENDTLYLTNSPLVVRYAWVLSYAGLQRFNNFNLNIPQWLDLHKLPKGQVIQPWVPRPSSWARDFKKNQLKNYLLSRPEFQNSSKTPAPVFYFFGDNGESDHLVYQEVIRELRDRGFVMHGFIRRVQFQADEESFEDIHFFSSEQELFQFEAFANFPDQSLKQQIMSLSENELIPEYVRNHVLETTPAPDVPAQERTVATSP